MSLKFDVKIRHDTKSLDRIVRQLESVIGKKAQVGFFDGKLHPGSTDGTTEATVAAINEFGVPEDNIPERPFMFTTVVNTKALKEMARGFRTLLERPASSALAQLFRKPARLMQKEMSATIRGFSSPANAPFTVAKKGFDNPLVETGHMRDNVDHRIV